jgi:hypothetical protein
MFYILSHPNLNKRLFLRFTATGRLHRQAKGRFSAQTQAQAEQVVKLGEGKILAQQPPGSSQK